jgi:hypothetical protein
MNASALASSLIGWALLAYIIRRAWPGVRHDLSRARVRLFGERGHRAGMATRAHRAQRGSTAAPTTPDAPPDDDAVGFFVMDGDGRIVYPPAGRNATWEECSVFCLTHHEDEDSRMWNLDIFESSESNALRVCDRQPQLRPRYAFMSDTIARALDDEPPRLP